MITVSVKNLSPALRSYPDIDGRSVTVKPGETKTFEMHTAHVIMLERTASKDEPVIAVEMDASSRSDYDADCVKLRLANRGARIAARATKVVNPEREQKTKDVRFITDPRTTLPTEMRPKYDGGEEPPKRVYTLPKKKIGDEPKAKRPPVLDGAADATEEPASSTKKKATRVALKKK